MASDWQPRKANAWSPKDDYPLKLQLGLPRHPKEWSTSCAAADKTCKRPLEVRVSVRITQILNVGRPMNTFRCAFDLTLEWEDATFKPVINNKVPFDQVDWARHWRPRWSLANLASEMHREPLSSSCFTLHPNPDTLAPRVRLTQRVAGTFFEPFSLRRFPFDVQSLTIAISCDEPLSTVVFVDAKESTLDAGPFSPRLAEWLLLRRDTGLQANLPMDKRTPFTEVLTQQDGTRDFPFSVFVARMPVKRKTGYYLTNIIPIYFIIVVYGWLAFGNLPEQDNQDQLNFLASLLLTMISFKFTYRETLPKVHYLTLMDWYVYASVVMLGLQGVIHVWAKHSTHSQKRPRELYGLVLLVCLWFAIHGGIIIYAYWYFSYLTELGPKELQKYIDRFRKSDQAIESRARGNYRGHLGDGLSPHKQSLQIPNFGARLPTVTSKHIQREASLMNTPEVGMLFSDGDDTPSSPQGVCEHKC